MKFQFSLRHVLVLIVVVAVVFLFVARTYQTVRLKGRYDLLVETLENEGITEFRVRWYDGEVHINDPSFDDQDLAAIAEQLECLSGLVYLDLARTSVSGRIVEIIDFSKFPQLRLVRLDETEVKGEILAVLRSRHQKTDFVDEIPAFEL